MSDRDTSHLLDDLQQARFQADSNERAFRQANLRCVELMAEVERLRDLLRWRDAKSEPPQKDGRYFVISWNELFGSDFYSVETGWDHRFMGWTHWRPIGPLPGEGGV